MRSTSSEQGRRCAVSEEVLEEDFVDFVVGADATRTQHAAAAREWRERSADEQALINQTMSWISLVGATKESVADKLQVDCRNVNKTSNSTPHIRLWHLDIYDNDLQHLLNTYKEYMSGTDSLERVYASMAREESFILGGIRSRQKVVRDELEGVEEEACKTRATVYDLKRRSPGRKAEKERTRAYFDQLNGQAYEQMRRGTGPVLRHPNVPVHPAVIQWHEINLPNDGGQNLSTVICIGVARDGRIVERRVRKSVQHDKNRYGSAHKWWHYTNGDMLPLEYVTQMMVGQSVGARFALQNTSRPSFEAQREIYHLYLEFAPCGDLDKAIDAHIAHTRPLPEVFVMLVFQSLIETAMIMKKNSTEINVRAPPGWLEVIHRDLKPANIFFSLPDKQHFPSFPTPKIADYGLGTLTNEDDPLNPTFYNSVGTSGYDAPEQTSMHDPSTGKPVDDFPILSPCNVWAIGAVMYSTMTLTDLSSYDVEPLPYHVAADKEKATGDEFERNLDDDLKKRWGHLNTYNRALRHAAQACMSFLPEARPTLEQLKEWVEAEMRDNESFRSARMGWGFGGGLYFEEEKEEWKLGMCWPPGIRTR